MKLGILLTTSPENQDIHTVIGLAEAARNAGHSVDLFLMDDGVYCVVREVSCSSRLSDLLAKGVSLTLCGHTAEERGVKEEACIEGVKFAGQYELSCMVNEADRFLTFGG
jgi:sulfur relay (sulfurtransferase) complex TusBCD TusD component (DsrE family)